MNKYNEAGGTFEAADSGRAQPRVDLLVDLAGLVVGAPPSSDAVFTLPTAAGENAGNLVHRDDRYLFDLMLEAVTKGADRRPIVQLRWSCGNERWTRVSAQFSCGEANTVRLTIAKDDIASARRAERQMRQAVDGSAQGIIVRTVDRVLYMNQSFAEMLGYGSVQDCIDNQSHINSLIHPDDAPKVLKHIQARLAGREKISQYEFRLLRRDGSVLWVETFAAGVNWNGQPASLSWINNISQRKRMENELVRRKEEAEFANRSKTEFLANITHELRTPLNAIIGFSEMIGSRIFGPIDDKYAEYAQDIHRSGLLLLDLISDVLDLSKLEAGKLDLRESVLPVATILEEMVKLLRDRASKADVVVKIEIGDALPDLIADERSVKQILLNLISNAIKFTPRGGVVTVQASSEAGGICLSVSDTGIGMSESEIEIALSPFGQIDSKLARKHQGSGLGLPICRSLMMLHGGCLDVTSKPDCGTSVSARFPSERSAVRKGARSTTEAA